MKKIGRNKSNIGIIGEEIAQKWLISKGCTILHLNFKTYHGEIDIVAQKEGQYSFVEVKSIDVSYGTSVFNPEDNFTSSKQLKMLKAIEYYLLKYNINEVSCKTLLLCVFIDKISKTARIRKYENPF